MENWRGRRTDQQAPSGTAAAYGLSNPRALCMSQTRRSAQILVPACVTCSPMSSGLRLLPSTCAHTSKSSSTQSVMPLVISHTRTVLGLAATGCVGGRRGTVMGGCHHITETRGRDACCRNDIRRLLCEIGCAAATALAVVPGVTGLPGVICSSSSPTSNPFACTAIPLYIAVCAHLNHAQELRVRTLAAELADCQLDGKHVAAPVQCHHLTDRVDNLGLTCRGQCENEQQQVRAHTRECLSLEAHMSSECVHKHLL